MVPGVKSQTETNSPYARPSSGYLVLVFVMSALVAILDSPSYSLLGLELSRIIALFLTPGPTQAPPPYLVLLSLIAPLLAVIAFYLIGRQVDIAGQTRLLVSLLFAGALIGNLVGFYLYSNYYGSGSGWEVGFGYARSFGVPEPSSILEVLIATVGSAMIPVAGLSLAHFRRQPPLPRPGGVEIAEVGGKFPYRTFLLAAFIIAALALPVAAVVYRFLSQPPPDVLYQTTDPWSELVSGYIGILIYPALLIAIFYFLGRNAGSRRIDISRSMLVIFVAGAAGLLVGILAYEYVRSPSSFLGVLTLPAVLRLGLDSMVDAVPFLFVGFASASLGIVRALGDQHGTTATRTRGSYVPIALAVLAVALVATSGVVGYSYLGTNGQASRYSCIYQAGNAFFLQVVTDQGRNPVVGLDVRGQLVNACPVVMSCMGSCPNFVPTVIRSVGTWDFATNSSGYVSVPNSMLRGSDLWFSLGYTGHTYQARFQICGGGTTLAHISLPSGAISSQEVPTNGYGVGAEVEENGTQVIQGCNPVGFSGNATIS
jgi:hypothetical protein